MDGLCLRPDLASLLIPDSEGGAEEEERAVPGMGFAFSRTSRLF